MRALPLLFALCPLLLFSGCSLNKTEESRKDREMALLNQRKYHQSVDELEQRLRENPTDRPTALLLAMAHIGRANAEMFQLFTAVLSHQGLPPPAVLANVRCGDETWDSLQDKSVECIASRILRQVPDNLDPDFGRAQELLRAYYPDPKSTEADVNFFAAYVELHRVLNRVRYLTGPRIGNEVEGLQLDNRKFDDITTPEFERADHVFGLEVHQLKTLGDEFMQVFRRLKYSYGKITKYTASIDGKPILEHNGHVLVFDENMSVDRLARFAIILLDDEKGKTNQRLNGTFSGLLSRAAPTLMKLARDLRYVGTPTEAWNHITSGIEFENLLKTFLRGLAGARAPSADLHEWMIAELDKAGEEVWKNPPGLFGDLVKAMRESWETESLRALSAYHKASAPEWKELAEILRLWGEVRDHGDDRFEGRLMAKVLVDRRERDREYLKFPVTVTPRSMDGWFREVLSEAAHFERDYERGVFSPDRRPPNPQRRALVHEAFTRSVAWLEKNLLLQR